MNQPRNVMPEKRRLVLLSNPSFHTNLFLHIYITDIKIITDINIDIRIIHITNINILYPRRIK